MSNILNKDIVLVVNSLWQVIGIAKPKNAIKAMFSSEDGINLAAKAFVIDYSQEGDVWDFEKPTVIKAVFLEEWLEQPIRPFDNVVHTAKREIRIPTVLMAHNYNKIPKKKIHPTKRNVYDMYDGIDYWTGKKIPFKRATLEHVIPKSKGGKDSWKNLAISDKDINNSRGNTDVKDFKYKPHYELKEPKEVPISALIKEIRHRDWRIFIK